MRTTLRLARPRQGTATVDANARVERRRAVDSRRCPSQPARDLIDLINATTPVVWRLCVALVGPDRADAVTLDTYARADRSGQALEANDRATLLAIARRRCVADRRRQRAIAVRCALPPIPRNRPAAVSHDADAGSTMTRLPWRRREAFALTVVAGLPYADTARICRCRVSTVRRRVAAARTDLVDQRPIGLRAAPT